MTSQALYSEVDSERGRTVPWRGAVTRRPRPGWWRRGLGASCPPGTLRMPWGSCIRTAPTILTVEPSPAVPPSDAPAPAADASAFRPVAVENPGGGRIKDKSAPPPGEIVHVQGTGGRRIPLRRVTAQAWQALVAAARRDGIPAPVLLPTSGFRDPELQRKLWENAKIKYKSEEAARKWVAPPGHSPHQTGRAIDFYLGGQNSSANVAQLRTLPAYHWMVANARRFGFYPYEAEPWHWEYNPPAQSTASPGPDAPISGEVGETLEISPGPTDTVGLRRNIVSVAVREWERWNAHGRKTETDPSIRSTLADYWRRGAGVQVRESDLGSTSFQAGHPWSAAFISWVMRHAGAGSAFRYAPSHSTYIYAAKQDR